MKFRKKPVVIEAVQFTGTNHKEIKEFTRGGFEALDPNERERDSDITAEVWDELHETWVGVKDWQWIIEGLAGEFYPHDAELFEQAYDRVEGE